MRRTRKGFGLMPGLTTHRPCAECRTCMAYQSERYFSTYAWLQLQEGFPKGFAIFCSTCQSGSCFLGPTARILAQDLADFWDALGQKMRRRNSQLSDFMYIFWISIAFIIVRAYHLQMYWDRCSWFLSQGLLFGAAWPWLQDASRVTVWLCMIIERCNHCMLVEVA